MTTITVNIPAGMSADEFSRRIEMISSPDWLASWWHIDDVRMSDPDRDDDWNSDLTDEEAREVLRLADKYHDSENGITCYVLESWINQVRQQRKAAA
jgi:hypothetical protein